MFVINTKINVFRQGCNDQNYSFRVVGKFAIFYWFILDYKIELYKKSRFNKVVSVFIFCWIMFSEEESLYFKT